MTGHSHRTSFISMIAESTFSGHYFGIITVLCLIFQLSSPTRRWRLPQSLRTPIRENCVGAQLRLGQTHCEREMRRGFTGRNDAGAAKTSATLIRGLLCGERRAGPLFSRPADASKPSNTDLHIAAALLTTLASNPPPPLLGW